MGRRMDYVARRFYGKHLGGNRGFLNNPVENRQEAIERFYVRRISEMCMARFKWTGLPKSVDEIFLEQTLFQTSLAVFYFDKRYDQYLALRANQAGPLNVTDNPTKFRVYGTNFMGGTIRAKDCVPIWGSLSRAPEMDIIYLYANKLAVIDRTIEINADNARRTKVIVATENERLTMANVANQLAKGDPAIYVTERSNGMQLSEKVEAIDLGVDVQHIERLHILKVRLWNELMMHLGIDGANQDKKERLVSNEVEANAEQINLGKSLALKTRRLACEQINSKYPDLNVTVDYDIQDEGAVGFNTEVGNE